MEYARIVRRRAIFVLMAVTIAPVTSVLIAKQQANAYQATASTLLNHINLGASLSGVPQDSSAVVSPDRALATEAALARTSTVAAAVIKATGVRLTPSQFLSSSSALPSGTADLIDLSVTSGTPDLAIRLTNEYAKQFAAYSNKVEGTAADQAYADVTRHLNQLRAQHQTTSPLYATLRARQQQIVTLQALQTPTIQVVKVPEGAPQVAPRPKRALLIGLLGGIVLATALVLLVEAIDTRIHDVDELEAALGIPLLGRIPPGSNTKGARSRDPVTLENDDAQAEGYRILRTNLMFRRLSDQFNTLLVTSPESGDGKTSVVASLGVAFARSGLDVIVADLDARKPELAARLGRNPRYGMTEVALGRSSPLDALESVELGAAPLAHQLSTARESAYADRPDFDQTGRLRLLGFGRLHPPAPHEFVSSEAVREILAALQKDSDLVIIDSAPILRVGDSLSLTGVVDATLFAVKLTTTTRTDLKELRRVITASPARSIGVVATNASFDRNYGYGYGYGYTKPPPPPTPPKRTGRNQRRSQSPA
jgi:Mrp family chromosome partitioning ATPase/capsular polysaccharide biosynthesis protein